MIHNVVGQKVEIVTNRIFEPGAHSIVWDAESLTSGVYTCRLTVDGSSIDREILLVK